MKTRGHVVAQVFEELRYKPEDRGFDFRWCHWNFYCHDPSGGVMALWSNRNENQ